jgi:Cd2+/Zn2+-exporting ATPase
MNDMRDDASDHDHDHDGPDHDHTGHDHAGHDHANDPAAVGGASDETFAWTNPDESTSTGGDARATAERMVSQLQSMIDTVATQAAPVVRQIGAKAAELAAVAADRAGPLAHKAADATADASVRLAEKSRTWAADLRSKVDGSDDADADSRAGASVDGADDAVEHAAQDDPAEGNRG